MDTNILTVDILRSILEEKSMTFTRKEIMEMLDEELDKPEEIMDVDLIDLCLDALDAN